MIRKALISLLALVALSTAGYNPSPPYQAPWGAAIAGGNANLDSLNSASLVLRNQGPGYLIQSSAGSQVTDLNCSSGDLAAFSVGGSTSWFGIANNGTTLARGGASGSVQTTTDGVTFSQRASGLTSLIAAGAYGLGKYIMVGTTAADSTNGISVSTDAVTWSPVKSINASKPYRSVACNTGMCLIGGTASTLISTTNFSTFTAQTYGGTSGTIQVLAWSQDLGLWMGANGAGAIRTSPDGVTWTSRTSGVATALYAAVWDDVNNLFVVVGAGGVILTSPNGTAWTLRTSGTTRDLFAVYAGGGNVIAAGDSLRILKSTNSTSWTSVSIPGDASEFDAGGYVGSTNLVTGENGITYYSADATTWTRTGSVQPACKTPNYLTRDSVLTTPDTASLASDSIGTPTINGQQRPFTCIGNSLCERGSSNITWPQTFGVKYKFQLIQRGSNGANISDSGIVGQAYRQTYYDTSITMIDASRNDMSASTPKYDYARSLAAIMAVSTVPSASKSLYSAATYGGTWATSLLQGYTITYNKTSTTGDSVVFTCTGSACVFAGVMDTAGGSMAVKVDGISWGTVDQKMISVNQHGFFRSPAAYVINGLSAGSHSITLTAQSNRPVTFAWWKAGSATYGAQAYAAGATPGLSDFVALSDTFTLLQDSVATNLRLAGLGTWVAPYRIAGASQFLVDGTHPSPLGCTVIADTVFKAWAAHSRTQTVSNGFRTLNNVPLNLNLGLSLPGQPVMVKDSVVNYEVAYNGRTQMHYVGFGLSAATPTVVYGRAQGTLAAPVQVGANNSIAEIDYKGYHSDSTWPTGMYELVRADGTPSTGNYGMYKEWVMIPGGNTTLPATNITACRSNLSVGGPISTCNIPGNYRAVIYAYYPDSLNYPIVPGPAVGIYAHFRAGSIYPGFRVSGAVKAPVTVGNMSKVPIFYNGTMYWLSGSTDSLAGRFKFDTLYNGSVVADTASTATVTLQGFGTDPTGTGRFSRSGGNIVIQIPVLTGTSDSAGMKVTGIPASYWPATNTECQIRAVQDNGVEWRGYGTLSATDGSIAIGFATTNIATGAQTSTTTFTTSGTKSVSAFTCSATR